MTDHQRELLEYTCRVCGFQRPTVVTPWIPLDQQRYVAFDADGYCVGVQPVTDSPEAERFWIHRLLHVCSRERREVRFAFNAEGEPITLVAMPPEPDFLGNPHMGFALNPDHTAESLALCMSQAGIGAEN